MEEAVNEDLVINTAVDPFRLPVHRIIDRLLPGNEVLELRSRVVRLLPADHMEAEIRIHLEMIPVEPPLMHVDRSRIDPVIRSVDITDRFRHRIMDMRAAPVVTDDRLGLYDLDRRRNQE